MSLFHNLLFHDPKTVVIVFSAERAILNFLQSINVNSFLDQSDVFLSHPLLQTSHSSGIFKSLLIVCSIYILSPVIVQDRKLSILYKFRYSALWSGIRNRMWAGFWISQMLIIVSAFPSLILSCSDNSLISDMLIQSIDFISTLHVVGYLSQTWMASAWYIVQVGIPSFKWSHIFHPAFNCASNSVDGTVSINVFLDHISIPKCFP